MSLCFTCKYRAESIERCRKWSGVGMVADPAPKAECKRHEGYGHPVESRDVCRDYEAKKSGESPAGAEPELAQVVSLASSPVS